MHQAPPPLTAPPEADVDVSPDGVDLSLIRWFLTLTPTERLAAAQDMIDTVWALRGADEIPSGGEKTR